MNYWGEAVRMEHQAALHRLCEAENARLPHRVYRPVLSRDGNVYCALFGKDLMEGVAGFGASPAEAFAMFDRAWETPVNSGRA